MINKQKLKSGAKAYLKKTFSQKVDPRNITTPGGGIKKVARKVAPRVAKAVGPKIKHFMDYKGRGIDLTARKAGPRWR